MTSATMPQWAAADSGPEQVVNENFFSLQHLAVYARDPRTTELLTWGYQAGSGLWAGFSVTAGTLSLTASADNYIVVARASGVISVSTTDTNWNNVDDYARVYKVVAGTTTVTSFEDHRAGAGGLFAGSGYALPPGGDTTKIVTITFSSSAAEEVADPADAGKMYEFTGTGAKELEFDTADGWVKDEVVHVSNWAASGNVTLVGTGVTLTPPKGGTLVLEPGDTVSVLFRSGTDARVFGSTEEA
jgi:hypothetical protein